MGRQGWEPPLLQCACLNRTRLADLGPSSPPPGPTLQRSSASVASLSSGDALVPLGECPALPLFRAAIMSVPASCCSCPAGRPAGRVGGRGQGRQAGNASHRAMSWIAGLAARAGCWLQLASHELLGAPGSCWKRFSAAGKSPPAPEGSPADLQLAGRIKRVRRCARIGWARTLLQLAAEFNQEAPL